MSYEVEPFNDDELVRVRAGLAEGDGLSNEWGIWLIETLDAARRSEEWRDHTPSGYEDMTGYGQVHCSCGWDSSDVLGWEQHINAATSEGGTE